MYVWEKSCSRDEVRFLTKTFQYLTFNSIFQDCTADDPDIQNLCARVKLVCMYVCQAFMYVWDKIMLQRRGPIPYENLSVFDVLFNFSRFVRGGTVGDPDIQLVCMFAKLVCMFAKHVCMSEKNHAPGTRSDSLGKRVSI